jgi:hypothetical protein
MKSGGGGPASQPPQVEPAIAIVAAPTFMVVVSGLVDAIYRIAGQTTVGPSWQPAATTSTQDTRKETGTTGTLIVAMRVCSLTLKLSCEPA